VKQRQDCDTDNCDTDNTQVMAQCGTNSSPANGKTEVGLAMRANLATGVSDPSADVKCVSYLCFT